LILRGYKGSIRQPVRVDPRIHTAREVGDEALALAAAFPHQAVQVWVGRNRRAAAARAESAGATLRVLDDGFQRRDIARNVDILVVDGATLFGNKRCLPAGPLREPLGARTRADFAVIVSETLSAEAPQWQGLPAYRLTLGTQLPEKLKAKPL